jgi:hypothetical protein
MKPSLHTVAIDLAKQVWLIVAFGEPGLVPLSAWTGEGQKETKWCPPPSSRRQPALHAHGCHGVRVPAGAPTLCEAMLP